MDPRVKAIRDDVLVGSTSISVVEYSYTDDEIIERLNDYVIVTPREAVEWARDVEGYRAEQGLNQRWGEDDDPQLLAYNEWQKALDEHPIAC